MSLLCPPDATTSCFWGRTPRSVWSGIFEGRALRALARALALCTLTLGAALKTCDTVNANTRSVKPF